MCDARDSIHLGSATLKKACSNKSACYNENAHQSPNPAPFTAHLGSPTVPMDRAFNGQIILDEHFQLISLVNFDQWAGLLAIDEVHLARDAVYKQSVRVAAHHATVLPGALVPLWMVKLYVRRAALDDHAHSRMTAARAVRSVNMFASAFL